MIKISIQNINSYFPVLFILPIVFFPFKYGASLLFISIFALYLVIRFPFSKGTFEKLVWSSFAFRILLIFVNEFAALLPNQPDAGQYNLQAMRIVDNMSRNLPVFYDIPYSLSVKSYSFFLSLFYSVFGQIPLLAILVNSFLGILTGVLVYKMSRELFEDHRIALLASGFTLFLPSLIAFTSYVLRDALVLFLTMSMLYHFVLMSKHKNVSKNILLAVLTFSLISIIRIQNFYLYIGFFAIYLSFLILRSKKMKTVKWGVLLLVILAGLFIYHSNKELINAIATYPLRAQPLRAAGGSAYLQNLQYHSFFDLIKFSPVRFFYFTFGPFLWNAHGSFLLLSALEGFVILIAAFFTLRYFLSSKLELNQNIQLFLLLFCLVGLLANSLVDSNFGTAVRHRMNYIIFFFIFASAYLRKYRIKIF